MDLILYSFEDELKILALISQKLVPYLKNLEGKRIKISIARCSQVVNLI